MSRTFNCGLGAVLVVAPLDAQRVLRQLQAHEEAWIVGSLVHKQPGETVRHLLDNQPHGSNSVDEDVSNTTFTRKCDF